MNEVRAVPKPSELTKNQTIKKCLFCDFSGLVYTRTKNCPKCNKKQAVVDSRPIEVSGEIIVVRIRKCRCGWRQKTVERILKNKSIYSVKGLFKTK